MTRTNRPTTASQREQSHHRPSQPPAQHASHRGPPCDGRGLLGGDLEQLELEHREDVRAGAVGARVAGQRLERASHHALRRAPPADDLRVAQRELKAVHLARVRARARVRVRVLARARVRVRVRVRVRASVRVRARASVRG